jgi:uncharacterized protein (TIRG00374 family)
MTMQPNSVPEELAIPANEPATGTGEVGPPINTTPGTGSAGRWLLALQAVGSVLILTIVFSALSSPGAVLAVFRQADWRWVALAVVVVALSEILSAVKWWMILRQAGCSMALRPVLRNYWIGMFYGTYLPGSVSGDAARVLLTHRDAGLTASATAVFMQRNTGLAAMLTLAIVFSLLHPATLGLFQPPFALLDRPLVWFLAAAIGYVFVNLVLVSPSVAEAFHRVASSVLPARGAKLLDRFLDSTVRGRALLRQFWRRSPGVLALSLFTQMLDLLVLLLLAKGLGFWPEPKAVYQAMTAASLAGMLPLTINGIGIREVGFGLMLQSGAGSGQAVALGLLTTGIYLACALPGGGLHGRVLLRNARATDQPT